MQFNSLSLLFIVNTESSSIANLQSQILSDGMSIGHKLERTKDSHIWHLKFRPYTSGTFKVNLASNGLSLLSKKRFILVRSFLFGDKRSLP